MAAINRLRSPSPIRGRSQTPSSRSGRSVTPLMRFREKSATPSSVVNWRSITPFLVRDELEKTSYEIGPNILLQLASIKSIFDKALIMDISDVEQLPAKYIITEHSVFDRAAIMDISKVEVIIYLDDGYNTDADLSGRESMSPGPNEEPSSVAAVVTDEEEGTEKKKKKVVKKVIKKGAKKAAADVSVEKPPPKP